MTEQALDLPLLQVPAERPLSSLPPRQLVSPRLLIGAALVLFATVTFVCAWASDDAYITFRVIENFFGGHGLRWNIAERVQVYTHPLWMLLLLVARAFTGELYFTSIALSLLLSWTTAWLVAARVASGISTALIAVVLLSLSRAFVDYSTSGLENPLSHFLLVLFLMRSFSAQAGPRHLFQMGLLTALAMLNRLDLSLIFTPTLVFWLFRARAWRATAACAAGFLPLAAWEVFSVIYYGFPFPNTAYAKLGSGIGTLPLVWQSLAYYQWSFAYDPITPITLAVGLLSAFTWHRQKRLPALAAAGGAVFYLLYIMKIGGDFMGGRFFTAPFLVTVCLLARSPLIPGVRSTIAVLAVALVIALRAPVPTILSGGETEPRWEEVSGVVDERLYYYHGSGLLRAAATGGPGSLLRSVQLAHKYRKEGRKLVTDEVAIGFLGYYGGPEMHNLDAMALPDPLLARLPMSPGPWRIGHFYRDIPDGYIKTLETGKNAIHNPSLAEFYDRLSLLTRAPLWSAERWKEIWRFNTGGNQHLAQAYLAAAAQRRNR